jgi:hypothetical protein
LHILNIQSSLSANNVLYATCKLLTPHNMPWRFSIVFLDAREEALFLLQRFLSFFSWLQGSFFVLRSSRAEIIILLKKRRLHAPYWMWRNRSMSVKVSWSVHGEVCLWTLRAPCSSKTILQPILNKTLLLSLCSMELIDNIYVVIVLDWHNYLSII